MLNIGQLQAYVQLKEMEDATFVHPLGMDQARKIKMRVLAENEVKIFIVPVEFDYETGEVTEHHDAATETRFLCHLPAGLENIEFFWYGSFCLRVHGGDIWLDTYDNTGFNIESADPTSYANIVEREARNPVILEMERLARHNTRVMEEQMADMRQLQAQLEAARVNPSASAASAPTASVQPQGSGVSPTSDQQAARPAESGTSGEPQTNA